MASVYFLIPDPEKLTTYRVATDPNVEMTRVPHVGEYVSFDRDTNGAGGADYVVVLVRHTPGSSRGVDAEVYLHRVDMLEVQKALPETGYSRFDVPSTAWPVWPPRED